MTLAMAHGEPNGPTPRQVALATPLRVMRWTSLSACLLDALWSVGADHGGVVVPLVRRVLEPAASAPLTAAARANGDGHPLPRLLSRFPDETALMAAANRQRTSTRNGVSKAEAALRYARILVDHGVHELDDARRMLDTPELLSPIDRALSRVPGEGQHGIRRGYFWLLCGDEDRVKLSRRLVQWLADRGAHDPVLPQPAVIDVATPRLMD
ncbi:hypothetical protein [Petropleomorpha daqingensis]|uniref:Uncharacterized protein n=1 Tax=Petropleomorpha daqingensis TaxID=2026353 RepID=A0A853CA74_9ACTN|nr:hypothetical protein [Petropleomorpha daqingensis]NYJ03916.1 hypothetical protein [Petropleomorpha daqingensis]